MPMDHLKPGLAVVVAAACWSLSGSGCARGPSEDAARAAAASPLAANAPSDVGSKEQEARLDGRTRGWELGKRYVYRVQSTTVVGIGNGAAHAFDFDMDATIELTPITVSAETAKLYERVVAATAVSRAGNQEDFDRMTSEITERGCVFTLSGGRLSEIYIPRRMTAMAANAYREIASGLQVSRPAEAVDRYGAEEYDTTGKYLAHYEAVDGGEIWRKRKERYLSILGESPRPGTPEPKIVPEVQVSSGRVRLALDGRPVRVESHDELAINGAQAPVRTVTTLSLESRETGDAPPTTVDYGRLMASMDRVGADKSYGVPVPAEALDDARIHGLTFDSVLSRFEDLAPHEKDAVHGPINGAPLDAAERAKGEAQTEERSRLFVALGAIFRKHPETVAQALNRIRAKSPASTVLIDALGSASSTESQAALAELLGSRSLDSAVRSQVLLALSRTPRPGDGSIDALKATLSGDPFNAQALYGLGTYSRRLRDSGQTERANEIGEFLLDRFKLIKGPSQLMALLGAITNSGYAPALARITTYLAPEQPEAVRVAAVRALQSMHTPEVDEILASRVESDGSSEVRISAMDAAKVREPTDVLARALGMAVTRAQDARVRYRAVEVIAAWMPTRSELRGTLEQVAETDTEERVRNRAKAAL
jgi:hypothetical protein